MIILSAILLSRIYFVREYFEKRISVGYDRPAKLVFDDIESYLSQQIRAGWQVEETLIDETLEYIDLIFYRDIDLEGGKFP